MTLGTSEALAALAGIAVSLLFVLFPPLRRWFTGLEADAQSAVTGWSILILAAIIMFAPCFGFVLDPGVTCERQSMLDYFLRVVVGALLGLTTRNGTFLMTRIFRDRGDATKSLGPTAVRPKLLNR